MRPTVIRGVPVLLHGKACVTDRIVSGNLPQPFYAVLIERDHSFPDRHFPPNDRPSSHRSLHPHKEGTLPEGERKVSGGKNFLNNGRIPYIGGSG